MNHYYKSWTLLYGLYAEELSYLILEVIDPYCDRDKFEQELRKTPAVEFGRIIIRGTPWTLYEEEFLNLKLFIHGDANVTHIPIAV